MRTQIIGGLLIASAALLGPASTASAQQTVNFNLGYYTVTGQNSRSGADCLTCGKDVDVLVANRDFLTFDVKDFNSFTFGGEYLVPLGQFLEAGAGIAYSQSTVPSVYTNYVNADGSEVQQELKLRQVPIDLSVRVLPLRQTSPIQPYFGAGLTIINWKYTESGQFIDFNSAGRPIFTDEFPADGTNTGPVFMGGVRFVSGGLTAGGEVRYRQATGEVGDDFAGTKIDLGGWTYQATIGVRFGR